MSTRVPTNWNIKQLKTNYNVNNVLSSQGIEARCELDTQADTCCAGINCRPIYFTGQQCNVQEFHDDFTPVQNVPIASIATAWSDPTTGRGYILIFNEVLYFGSKLTHSLINPNQLWHFSIHVYDNPFEDDPFQSMNGHSHPQQSNTTIPIARVNHVLHDRVPNGY